MVSRINCLVFKLSFIMFLISFMIKLLEGDDQTKRCYLINTLIRQMIVML